MSTPQEERSDSPSLLLMISDAPELDASARSSHREVRRWTAHPSENANGSEFWGDPADPATYEWVKDARSVTAVVHLADADKSRATVNALREARHDSALLVLSATQDDAPGDGTLHRAGLLRDVLRLDLEDELVRLEAERRVWCLRSFAEGCAVVPILIHPNPDPDALSSALAVRTLLHRDATSAPILSAAPMSRRENRAMADLLHLDIVYIKTEDLVAYDRIVVVDMQPSGMGYGNTRLAVIDHHPPDAKYHADFIDVRPEYGAVATMMTQYLRATDEHLIDGTLATALLYGIRTDTDSLSRHVTPADVEAYAFVQGRIDKEMLRRIEKPSLPLDAVHAFGDALHSVVVLENVATAYAGILSQDTRHILADIADFCMTIEGVARVIVAGRVDDDVIISLRDVGTTDGVMEIARALGDLGHTGGGHATMARAVVPLEMFTDWKEGREVDAIRALIAEASQR